jgi:superfamily I DNA/RNA helicase
LEKNPEVAEARTRNLRELMATMDGIGNDPMERLADFLENVTLDSDRAEEKESKSDAVTLITMHSCKGLGIPACVYCRPGGRLAAALALQGGGHDG